jgi:adenosylmethionine-8-amino-7-oxononanoate aminotransferase
MTGIELVMNKERKTPFALEDKIGIKVCRKAREKGLIIRPLGNVIVLMPHLTVSKEELKQITTITAESIKEVTELKD